jgi:hypothetical protein
MNSKPLFIEQLPYPAHQKNLMMLIIPAVPPAFEGLQLREFLLPITQYVRLDPT